MDHFELVSDYKPAGDQPQAIDKLVEGINSGMKEQTLLGVTGRPMSPRSIFSSSRSCRV